ncbi:MAG: phage tail protein [Firmicutes bacterium]|nr:phage tail protein [Bacillota bacterium]
MMYSIYADDTLIYSPSVKEFCLYDIVLNVEDNSAGTLQFNMLSEHPSFLMLKKLATLITVKNGDVVLWKGRIISDDRDINNVKKIQCEGQLAFLNDSIFPAFDFSGSPEQLFRDIIQNHNSQVSPRQRFRIGNVTVKDNNDYIVRSSINDARTWAALKDKCFQSTLGGHLRIRYEADGDYIDWLEDYTEVSGQSITFGRNIIDLLVNTSATETFTAIRPKGALADEAGTERIDIKSVNDGKDYIIDEEKAAEYGIIFASPEESIWEDVTLPQNLLQKARVKLTAGTTLKKTIEVRAVDLNLTDAQIEALKVCTYVQVVSPLHGIAEYYLLSKAELHLDAPEHTRYTLGAVKATFTDANKTQLVSVMQTVGASIPSAVSQLKNDEGFVTEQTVIEVVGKTTVSPTIEVSEEAEDFYKLKITSVSGEIETPNLMGPPGDPGADGKDGADGRDGIDGQNGAPGESAYAVAVKNGFAGSEEEWLASLKGEAPVIGANGNWFIGGEDTGFPSRGERGEKGDPGAAGGTGGGFSGMYAFEIRDGCLWIVSDSETVPDNFYINSDCCLCYVF